MLLTDQNKAKRHDDAENMLNEEEGFALSVREDRYRNSSASEMMRISSNCDGTLAE